MQMKDDLISLNPDVAAKPLDERAKIFDMPAVGAPETEHRIPITGLTFSKLAAEISQLGKEKYRTEQIFFWLYRRAGIAGASSHSCRRSFITRLASKGISVRVLASLAGHRDISVTQKYIDVHDDMKRAAVELI